MTHNSPLGKMLADAPLPRPPFAEQTMAMPAIQRRWTREQVLDLIDESRAWPRYELIDGQLLVTPSPGDPHQLAVLELLLALAPFVEREGLGLTFTSPSDVELRDDTITQPDIYVLPAGPEAEAKGLVWSEWSKLLLAVEVLSPSSLRTDRVTKRDFYMESGVAEYWVVDLEARIVERWLPRRETPMVERDTLAWMPRGASSALSIELPPFFDRIRQKSEWARKARERR